LGLDYPWKSGAPPDGVNGLNYCAEDEIDYAKPVKNGPNELGFDYSFLVPGSLDMSPYVYLENGKATAIPDSISPKVPFPAYTRRGEIAPDFTHQTTLDKLTDKAVEFINNTSQDENPFLLYFPLTGPHKPALTAKRFVGKSGFGPYGDLLMQVDWTVGEVMGAIKKNGIEDNTIVFYTSDNGSYMFRINDDQPDHIDDEAVQGYHADSRQSNYIWRGTKADIYEGGHRIPFIVKWPGKVNGGSVNGSTICLTDIFSTIADITDITYAEDEGEDSFSFKKSLLKKDADQRPPVIHHSVNGTFSIRHGKWKMIFAEGSGVRQKPVGKPFEKPYQLFEVEKDASERDNVIEDHPEVAEILTNYLQQIREGTSKGFKRN
ncbi:MAG: sulfatase-like hydrolase/transferase, partial [Cyclobacteriaceae bacterium]|nr:sulfatase-like hydrolase/transferase [Cyclobacteriaceae bacterium]